MSRAVPKRLKRLVKAAEAQGWTFDFTGKGHPRLTPPPGATDRNGERCRPVTFSLTPSDTNADRPSTSYLRRCGIRV